MPPSAPATWRVLRAALEASTPALTPIPGHETGRHYWREPAIPLIDAWRLSVGTFTALPVRPTSSTVDRPLAGRSIALAPLAVLPVAAVMALVLWLGTAVDVPDTVTAVIAVAVGVLGNRGFHLDGLADTVDALAAWGDRATTQRILKSGDVGPAGAVALILVIGLQVAGIAAVGGCTLGPVVVASAYCAARGAAAIGCMRGIAPARGEGLGAIHAQSLRPAAALGIWLVGAAAVASTSAAADIDWWRPALATVVALFAVVWLLRRSAARFGGMVGDVLGAGIEVSFALMLAILV